MIAGLTGFGWSDDGHFMAAAKDRSPYLAMTGIETEAPLGDLPSPTSQPTHPNNALKVISEHGKTAGEHLVNI